MALDLDAIGRKFDDHASVVEAALKKAAASDGELSARLTEIEQKMARRGGGRDPAPQSLGEIVAASEGYKSLSATQGGRVRINLKTTITTGSTSGGPLAPPDFKPDIDPLPRRKVRVRDLLTPGRTDSTSVEYPRQTTRTNNAAMVAEEAEKPENALAWELVTAPTRTLATLLPVSKQILDDAPMLQSTIDGELRYMLADVEEQQLLMGSGTGQNLSGIYTQATAFSPPITLAGATRLDVLLLAILQVQNAGYEPDGLVLNPADWVTLQVLKDSEGRYIGSGPFSAEQVARVWRLPTVTTPSMTVDKFLVTTKVGAQIFDRQDATIEISTEHENFFALNKVMLRAEQRLALAVKRPLAFVKADFSDAITAATA